MDRRVAGQGEKCVLLVKGQQFGEVVATDATTCTVMLPDGRDSFVKKSEIAEGAFSAVPATKIFKGDGTWMYFAPGPVTKINPTGTQWYTRGGVFV